MQVIQSKKCEDHLETNKKKLSHLMEGPSLIFKIKCNLVPIFIYNFLEKFWYRQVIFLGMVNFP